MNRDTLREYVATYREAHVYSPLQPNPSLAARHSPDFNTYSLAGSNGLILGSRSAGSSPFVRTQNSLLRARAMIYVQDVT
jgi:hypothetical protein